MYKNHQVNAADAAYSAISTAYCMKFKLYTENESSI